MGAQNEHFRRPGRHLEKTKVSIELIPLVYLFFGFTRERKCISSLVYLKLVLTETLSDEVIQFLLFRRQQAYLTGYVTTHQLLCVIMENHHSCVLEKYESERQNNRRLICKYLVQMLLSISCSLWIFKMSKLYQ